MTVRSFCLVAYLVPLLAVQLLVLGSGVSLASSGPAIVANTSHSSAIFCRSDSRFSHRGNTQTLYSRRIAQLHCSCCGRDENGHCNHQCCN